MCIPFTDVAQVANAARNYEILHERDDDNDERPDKRQKSGDQHQPTTQQSSHRNHDGSDMRGGDDNHRSNNNYSGNNNRSAGNGCDQSSSPTDLSILISSSPGVLLRANPTRSALRVDTDTQESVVELLLIRSQVHRVAFLPSLRIMLLRPQMVNTCTDAELAAAVQNALQTLLPQIRAEIREEFRTGSGPSGSGGNPPPVTIHTWLERFNKQKPCSI
nr:zinc finger, CCHC-type, retrotransposon Gag domain protein [Tanacetum cinerariifolium]